jgi:segregation and condensation protein B
MHIRRSILRCGSWHLSPRVVPSARPFGAQSTGRRIYQLPVGGGATGGEVSSGAALSTASRVSRRSRLEAVLFLSREALGLRKLAQSANLADATEARTLLADLRGIYDRRGCAFQVEQLAGGYQLRTRPKFAPWLRPLVPASEQIRLTPPALETLSVVAYRQPVLRADVEAIRGVACGEILRQLMERDLLRIVGRSEELGRPLWYGTTKRFLEVFGLCSLDDLPLAAELRRMAEVEPGERSGGEDSAPDRSEQLDAA